MASFRLTFNRIFSDISNALCIIVRRVLCVTSNATFRVKNALMPGFTLKSFWLAVAFLVCSSTAHANPLYFTIASTKAWTGLGVYSMYSAVHGLYNSGQAVCDAQQGYYSAIGYPYIGMVYTAGGPGTVDGLEWGTCQDSKGQYWAGPVSGSNCPRGWGYENAGRGFAWATDKGDYLVSGTAVLCFRVRLDTGKNLAPAKSALRTGHNCKRSHKAITRFGGFFILRGCPIGVCIHRNIRNGQRRACLRQISSLPLCVFSKLLLRYRHSGYSETQPQAVS